MERCRPLVILYGDRSVSKQWAREKDPPGLFEVAFRPAHGKPPHVVVVWGEDVLDTAERSAVKTAIVAQLSGKVAIAFQPTADFGKVSPEVKYLSELEQSRL